MKNEGFLITGRKLLCCLHNNRLLLFSFILSFLSKSKPSKELRLVLNFYGCRVKIMISDCKNTKNMIFSLMIPSPGLSLSNELL